MSISKVMATMRMCPSTICIEGTRAAPHVRLLNLIPMSVTFPVSTSRHLTPERRRVLESAYEIKL